MATVTNLNLEARSLCDADTNSYQDAALLRAINMAYERVVGWLIQASGDWQFDDTNFTDLPIGLTTMVDGQYDYSFASSHLEIRRVAVKHTDGKFYFLDPVDALSMSDPIETLYPTSGIPTEYDKQGGSLFLLPAPASGSVTLASGLKVYFARTADIFTSTEVSSPGTKEPGFASPWHYILSYMAAIPYCMKYHKDRVALYNLEIERMKQELIAHYTRRERDTVQYISTGGVSFK